MLVAGCLDRSTGHQPAIRRQSQGTYQEQTIFGQIAFQYRPGLTGPMNEPIDRHTPCSRKITTKEETILAIPGHGFNTLWVGRWPCKKIGQGLPGGVLPAVYFKDRLVARHLKPSQGVQFTMRG